jgi:hypothetical protein
MFVLETVLLFVRQIKQICTFKFQSNSLLDYLLELNT